MIITFPLLRHIFGEQVVWAVNRAELIGIDVVNKKHIVIDDGTRTDVAWLIRVYDVRKDKLYIENTLPSVDRQFALKYYFNTPLVIDAWFKLDDEKQVDNLKTLYKSLL